TQEHLDKIFRMTSEVVFCFDGDRAGRQAAWRAMENSLALARDGRELKFMFLPEGHDPDTLVAAEGAMAFENRLRSALPLSEYLVQQLTSEVDLDHVDGRAKLKALAAPLFARMPEGLYREMLAERLAARVGMPAATLKRSFASGDAARVPPNRRVVPAEEPGATQRGLMQVGHPGSSRGMAGRVPAARASAGRRNLLSQAIALVLHHPAAARLVKDSAGLSGVNTPGVAVLGELLGQAAAMDRPNTAMLLERWRSRPEYSRLSELAASEPMVAEAQGAAKELQMAVEKLLQEYGPGRRMDELLRKAEELGLNYDEKTELSLLLKAKGRPQAPT
ncbi:MAG: primase, partial [Gammaproteobacteria bacterium]|nr:primase [Gammaproteobacteria bacterium]